MRLQSELDRSFGKPSFDLGLSGPNVFPPINVFTTNDALLVRAEVPGIRPDGITVQFDSGRLTIAGERTEPEMQQGSYHRRERRFGRFSRAIQLPRDLDPEKATAEIRNGVLTVRIPKHAAARTRQIDVRAS
jgi:HSP20 family protein